MLRDKLQTLQDFALRLAEVGTTNTQTHTPEVPHCVTTGSYDGVRLPLSACGRYDDGDVLPGRGPLSSPSGVAAESSPALVEHADPPLSSRHHVLTQPEETVHQKPVQSMKRSLKQTQLTAGRFHRCCRTHPCVVWCTFQLLSGPLSTLR